MSDAPLTVVGIGADGWPGLGEAARAAVLGARLLVGSARQLALVPPTPAARRSWPSPIDSLLDDLVSGRAGPTCVLASGDPMLHGIGATLARRVDPARLTVHPSPSAFSLACVRLGWDAAETTLVSAVAEPVAAIGWALQPGRRLVVYVPGRAGAASVAALLREHGLGPSRLVALEELGGPGERIEESTADGWGDRPAGALHAVAVECRSAPGTVPLARVPGLPDGAFENDGQLTKEEVRAITLAALQPMPGELLWDVGAGSGAIGIEWLRAEPTARAIAVEARADRAGRVERNALALGVPRLRVVVGHAPAALGELEQPDAVFIGGGLTAPGLLERCWEALRPGGRIVANAVTLEGERRLHAAHAGHGGRLVRLEVSRAEPVGGYTGWRPHLPVVRWSSRKELA